MNERDEWATFLSTGATYDDADEWVRRVCDFHACDGAAPDGAVFVDGAHYAIGPDGEPLELYLFAREDQSERCPGVVFSHGGGWSGGTPFMHLKHCYELAALGYVTATVRYTLWPRVNIPEQVGQVKAAVRWMRANAASIGLDPTRLAVGGGSAGGHLALMTALTAGRFEGSRGPACASSEVQAAVLWYPAADLGSGCDQGLLDTVPTLCAPESVANMSPIEHVHPAAPPVLSIIGDQDTVTFPEMVARFHQRLDEHGVVNELDVHEGRGHAWDFDPDVWPDHLDRIATFLDEQLRAG